MTDGEIIAEVFTGLFALGNSIVHACNAGDVVAVEQLSKVLPDATALRAKDLALQNAQAKKAADELGGILT